MKKFLSLVSILVAMTSTAHAKGGKDGGGGNLRGSTPAEVLASFRKVTYLPAEPRGYTNNIYSLFFDLMRSRDYIRSSNPEAVQILDKMFGERKYETNQSYEEYKAHFLGRPVVRDLQTVKFEMRDTGTCETAVGEIETAASTKFSIGAPICISVAKLSALPKSELDGQIRALLMHELAHHFGYSEREANKIQDFVLYDGSVNQDTGKFYLQMATMNLRDRVHNILSNDFGMPVNLSNLGDVCIEIGALGEISNRANIHAINLWEDGAKPSRQELSLDLRHRTAEFEDHSISLKGYCGVPQSDLRNRLTSFKKYDYVPRGDLKALKKSLEKFMIEIEAFNDSIEANSAKF